MADPNPEYDPFEAPLPVNFSGNEQSDQSVLRRLNAVRLIVILLIAIGYASTMPIGPEAKEWLHFVGYDPSWYGIQVLFFISGWLAWRSLRSGRGVMAFIRSRAGRTLPWVALYTFIVAGILYPVLCNHDAPTAKSAADLALYFIKTVTLIDPGGPMPGALDNALYACILQGTVWTLRWGAIAYLALIILLFIKPGPRLVGLLFILCIIAHIGVSSWSLRTGSDSLDSILPGLRLGYAFLGGVWIRAMHPALRPGWKGWLGTSAVFLSAAILHYLFFSWTHMIEVLASLGWCALAMSLLNSPIKSLQNWPNLILPAYLGIWPTAQLLVYLWPEAPVMVTVSTTLIIILLLALLFGSLGELLVVRRRHRRVQTT